MKTFDNINSTTLTEVAPATKNDRPFVVLQNDTGVTMYASIDGDPSMDSVSAVVAHGLKIKPGGDLTIANDGTRPVFKGPILVCVASGSGYELRTAGVFL